MFSRGLPAIYIISFLSGISLGIFNPLISAFMEHNQTDDVWIGANSTVYFLFITLATPFVAKLLRSLGIRRTIMLGLLMLGLSAVLFPFTKLLPLWFVIRACMGIGACLFLVAGQTGLNHFCHQNNRAIANGLQALSFGVGLALGPIISFIPYSISPKLPFLLGSALILSGIFVAACGIPESFIVAQKSNIKILKNLTIPLHAAFAYGLAIATLVSLYPVYLLRQNYSVEEMSYIFSIFVFGDIVSTLPVTYLAQRYGQIKLIFTNVCIGIISLQIISSFDSYIISVIFSFLAGASIGPIFALTLSLIGDKLSKEDLPSGTAIFTGIYSIGCTVAPLISSLFMKSFGVKYIFTFTMLVFVLLFLRMILGKVNLVTSSKN
ncbi:MFS transporter [Nostoc sp. FACHB-110]|uniref:MFS transporter n=1 Tax=Nostoc sp. FACHB-110 TaxID=2692834 RepID=UPI001F559A5C|nr:MFS transporter [Nostoc sp. FACHB-110]